MNSSKDAKTKFTQINEAYATLGDEKRRQTYDITGYSANEQDNISEQWTTSGFANFDPMERMKQQHESERKFEQVLKEFDDFFNMEKNSDSASKVKGRDINLVMEIELESACNGCTKDIQYEKSIKCEYCSGTGLEPKSEPIECEDCSGKGDTMLGFKCKNCEGTGLYVKKCSVCSGVCYGKTTNVERVQVPKGVFDGVVLRLKEKGHVTKNGSPGDVLISLKVLPSPYFTRQGSDLYLNKKVTVT